jgi:ABC-type bacteriocin/lantibiotic exporter with double-glycine peptidase domain
MLRRWVLNDVLLAVPIIISPTIGVVGAELQRATDEPVPPADAIPAGEDEICGARCVQYVLEHFGKQSPDVIDLVREIQYPKLEKGARLQSVADALQQRGVYSFPMRISRRARLKWPHPVVVHLGEDEQAMGHFVIWLPSSAGDQVVVWFGLAGIRRMNEREWADRRSNAILLTAPDPIINPEEAVEKAPSPTGVYWTVFGSAAILIGLALLLVGAPSRHVLRFRFPGKGGTS